LCDNTKGYAQRIFLFKECKQNGKPTAGTAANATNQGNYLHGKPLHLQLPGNEMRRKAHQY
jgi:hypothetical protein